MLACAFGVGDCPQQFDDLDVSPVKLCCIKVQLVFETTVQTVPTSACNGVAA